MQVTSLDGSQLTFEEKVQAVVQATGVSRATAERDVAIAEGIIPGDVIRLQPGESDPTTDSPEAKEVLKNDSA